MEKEFIPYEQALALKEMGFDEKCFGLFTLTDGKHLVDVVGICTYSKEFEYRQVLAPLYQQAFRWFKEKYGLMSCTTPCSDGEYIFTLYDLNKCDLEVFVEDIEIMESEDSYEFFEDAELEGLKKLIEIIKTK